jgi:hypothetical protein
MIYISGMRIAKDYDQLRSLGIFNIINAAGDYCVHETTSEFSIKSYNIRDN